MGPLCLVFRASPFTAVDRNIDILVFSGADELGTTASRSPTKSPLMTPRDGCQMFNTKVRKDAGTWGASEGFSATAPPEWQQQKRQKTHYKPAVTELRARVIVAKVGQ